MKLEVDISCPKCSHTMKIPVGFMRKGNSKKCPRCSSTIEFEGDGHKAQKAMDDFEKSLNKMFK